LIGITLYNGRYKIEEEISRGGFATVYKASEQGREETVALKIGIVNSDPGYARSIREEARLLSSLDHPSIVSLHQVPRPGRPSITHANAVELPGSPPFFVMEYLCGGTLEDYLKQVGPLAPSEAAAIGLEVARGLDYSHRKNITHNDLKLENIVFRQPVQAGEPFEPVLVDFGIATRVRLQVQAGSIYIMSPEQLAEAKLELPPEQSEDMNPTKVDVWGMGVVLYRMLGGRLPFAGRNERTLTSQIMSARPTSLGKLTKIPEELDELIIDGCLAKRPEQRISLLELGKELAAIGNNVVASKGASSNKKGSLSLRSLFRD